MCGLTGFIELERRATADELRARLLRATDAIEHRGPDDSGEWIDESCGVALGFRRLSIIDLSPAGHQPMISVTGRYVLTFNGEVYNFERIRAELQAAGKAPEFRGHSDTEVMLAAIEAWGLIATVQRFIGMFAIALWDRQEQQLHLVRDRVGVKPLYYGTHGTTFLYGSELKALRAHPSFRREIDRDALALYVRHNYIPAPHSIYRNTFKLMPGHIMTVDGGTGMSTQKAYWSATEAAAEGIRNRSALSATEAVDQLDLLLRDAVALRMISDVPLGVFLSGGIDSSIVTAAMQSQSSRPVKTFSIGFHEEGYDEAKHAAVIARHLGTEHTELYVTPKEALDVIPKLPLMYDEPFADSSQIPTYLVSALARRHVTVALSGDGGDELFGGYVRYFIGRSVWKKVGWMGQAPRRALAGTLTTIAPQQWTRLLRSRAVPRKLRFNAGGDKIGKLAGVLRAKSPDEFYRTLVSHTSHPERIALGSTEPLTPLSDRSLAEAVPDFTDRMMLLDQLTYLPDDILVKVDRASMAVSLEAREPLLDHRLIEFAWSIPLSLKLRDGGGKWLLKELLFRYVPRELVERPKMGFGIPIDAWLRGPLREWGEALLDEQRLRDEGFFDPTEIRQKWREHIGGTASHHYFLWTILMFQSWLETNG